jgi:hypothetical protein
MINEIQDKDNVHLSNMINIKIEAGHTVQNVNNPQPAVRPPPHMQPKTTHRQNTRPTSSILLMYRQHATHQQLA